MKRIVEEPVKNDHYAADAAIVWCFDDRFSGLLKSLIRHEELAHTDLIRVAGGAKAIASPESECERAFMLDQLKKSIILHQTPMIFLMVHTGCGAYGEKVFPSREKEQNFYTDELENAEKIVQKFLLGEGIKVKILKYYADWNGLLEIP